MLPFLDRKKMISTIMDNRKGKSVAVSPEAQAPDGEMDQALHDAGHALLAAIESKSPIEIGRALRAAIEACEESESDGDGA
jgi:hypothetical protein